MKSYNGFTPAQRIAGDKIIKAAIARGELLPLNKTKCSLCGQDKGIRHYHCEDYSPENILNDVRPLCWRCHMMLHTRFRHPKSWKKYLQEVKSGIRYDPVYRGNDFETLQQHYID